MINLGNKREFFWDSYLVDEDKTTAFKRLMHPTFVETSFYFEKGVTALMFNSILKDDKGYKMYYMHWDVPDRKDRYLAVVESNDGINWIKPDLNIYPHPELEHNNVIFEHADSMFVFYDKNPECKPEEKYKAVAPYYNVINGETHLELWGYTSSDGYNFNLSHCIADDTKGEFDSLNTVHWNDGKYICYFRNMHTIDGEEIKEWNNDHIRDIRVMYSDDFKTWTEPKRLNYSDDKDYQLYTNCIFPYERAPHVLVGFPTRYCERKEWTDNTQQLISAPIKKKSMLEDKDGARSGLALTDCIFMCSRDRENWYRYNEAFMTPGYENEHNWVYGDCYPSYGLIDSNKETYYMYALGRRRSIGYERSMNRYEIRKDGFACYMADGEDRVLITKPLTFSGNDLHLNFSTSAYGYIYVDVLDEKGNELSSKKSFEIYGDTIDRKISFEDGSDFSEYAGKPVRLRFSMRDSKIFSLKFE